MTHANRYSIGTWHAPARHTPTGRFSILRADTCINCGRCINECIYDVHQRRNDDTRLMDDPHDALCKNCYRCIQKCPTRSLTKIINPEYLKLGDNYWTPAIITSIWAQAETGKIPVLGAGYRGPFTGPGFDSMWTDMSEIVRPTRDGIHGREYIHTGIDIGAKPDHLSFDAEGRLKTEMPENKHIPLPIILGSADISIYGKKISRAIALAGYTLGTLFYIDQNYTMIERDVGRNLAVFQILKEPEEIKPFINRVRMAEIPYTDHWRQDLNEIRILKKDILVSVALPFQPDTHILAEQMVEENVDVIHLIADHHGRAHSIQQQPFLIEALRWIHTHLVEKGIRDRITLLASGGIAAADHVPKAIISGADGIIIDKPLMIAMECLACHNCTLPEQCPRQLPDINSQWGAARIVNLMSAWHNQLLEVLGAMGIREVRRLRGERGRALYFEELEQEVFHELTL